MRRRRTPVAGLTHEGWFRTLVPPVLVVGNGVLPCAIPEDDYQSIVRINNYRLGGNSGEKVTHWAASGYINIEARPVSPVLIPWSKDYQRRSNRYDLQFGSRIGTETVHLRDNNHILRWWPKANIRWKYFPSVGFCLLSWLSIRRLYVDIIGFDGMTTGHEGDPSHKHDHEKTKVAEWVIIQREFIRKNLGER